MEGEMVAVLIKICVSRLAFTLCQKTVHIVKIQITHLCACVCGCVCVCSAKPGSRVNNISLLVFLNRKACK